MSLSTRNDEGPPNLGVLLQADPMVQDPGYLQNYNRYAYCYNSPLVCTDPSGYLSLFGHHILPGLFNNKTLRLAAAVAAAYFLGPQAGLLNSYFAGSAVAQTAFAGFVSGAISSGNLKGGIQGAFTAVAFFEAGDLITQGASVGGEQVGNWGEHSWQAVAVHGVVGCVTSMTGGGKCGAGALSASFSEAVTAYGPESINGNDAQSIVVHMTIAGTASVLGGGNFVNGAETAAFGYLFNYLEHGKFIGASQGKDIVDEAADWKGTPYKLVGANSQNQIGGDCSGTTYRIYDSVGDSYKYVQANDFGAYADKEGTPFARLDANTPRQPGDVLQFGPSSPGGSGHLAIYAGQDAQGNDLMWTASTSKQAYVLQQVKYFGRPVIGIFRYQTSGGN